MTCLEYDFDESSCIKKGHFEMVQIGLFVIVVKSFATLRKSSDKITRR